MSVPLRALHGVQSWRISAATCAAHVRTASWRRASRFDCCAHLSMHRLCSEVSRNSQTSAPSSFRLRAKIAPVPDPTIWLSGSMRQLAKLHQYRGRRSMHGRPCRAASSHWRRDAGVKRVRCAPCAWRLIELLQHLSCVEIPEVAVAMAPDAFRSSSSASVPLAAVERAWSSTALMQVIGAGHPIHAVARTWCHEASTLVRRPRIEDARSRCSTAVLAPAASSASPERQRRCASPVQ